jgi:4-hydroxy-2-oxoheptanedioate aldolase
MHESVNAASSVGVSPIVRIPANEGWMVKRVLDAGAHGVLVPLLYTVEEAKRLVDSAKFPPLGKRGFGSPFSMGSFDVKGDLSGSDYYQNANDNLLTCVQIETAEALACVCLVSWSVVSSLIVRRSNKSLLCQALTSCLLVRGIWVTI